MAEVRYKGRIAVLAAIVLLVFTAIGARLSMLHLKPADWVVDPIAEARQFESTPAANRGRIIDRKGRIMAMDTPAFHVCVDPKLISERGDPDAVAYHLSSEFNVDVAWLRNELRKSNRQYTRVKKYVSGHQIKRFKGAWLGVVYTPPELVDGVETNIYLKGVRFEEAPIRNTRTAR